MSHRKKGVFVRLDDETKDMLEVLSRVLGMPKNEIVAIAINREYCKHVHFRSEKDTFSIDFICNIYALINHYFSKLDKLADKVTIKDDYTKEYIFTKGSKIEKFIEMIEKINNPYLMLTTCFKHLSIFNEEDNLIYKLSIKFAHPLIGVDQMIKTLKNCKFMLECIKQGLKIADRERTYFLEMHILPTLTEETNKCFAIVVVKDLYDGLTKPLRCELENKYPNFKFLVIDSITDMIITFKHSNKS